METALFSKLEHFEFIAWIKNLAKSCFCYVIDIGPYCLHPIQFCLLNYFNFVLLKNWSTVGFDQNCKHGSASQRKKTKKKPKMIARIHIYCFLFILLWWSYIFSILMWMKFKILGHRWVFYPVLSNGQLLTWLTTLDCSIQLSNDSPLVRLPLLYLTPDCSLKYMGFWLLEKIALPAWISQK